MCIHQVSENDEQTLCGGDRYISEHSNIEGAEKPFSADSEKERSGCEDQFQAEYNQGSWFFLLYDKLCASGKIRLIIAWTVILLNENRP